MPFRHHDMPLRGVRENMNRWRAEHMTLPAGRLPSPPDEAEPV